MPRKPAPPAGVLAGPLEERLAALLARDPALRDAAGPEPRVEPCNKPNVGDARWSPLAPTDGGRPAVAAACRAWTEALATRPWVEKATAIPPAVYVRPALDDLLEWIDDAILEAGERYGDSRADDAGRTLLSYSSPNANKPLHLGHVRNNALGMALANLLEATGHEVLRGAVLSDWGIHICQAALAWERFADGATPESAGLRPDVFVGDLYVRFHTECRAQQEALGADAPGRASAVGATEIEQAVIEHLRRAEAGEPGPRESIARVTAWAEAGIAHTCRRLGSRFDVVLRERDGLADARARIARGLEQGRYRRRDDGSVVLDLAREDASEVTVLRADGTAVAYTQLFGCYVERCVRHTPDRVLVMLGREWELGLAILTEMLRVEDPAWAEQLEPVYYGMVTLPAGRMKSREGTVVEAHELIDQVRDRLLREWDTGDATGAGDATTNATGADSGAGVRPAAAPTDDPTRLATCEALAVSLLKLRMLEARREDDVPYDEQRLWDDTLPELARWIAALRWAESAGDARGPAPSTLPRGARDGLRRVLLALNDWPRQIARAARERAPSVVLRQIARIVQELERSGLPARDGPPPGRLAPALACVLRRGFALLAMPLPHELASLPPGFGARLERRPAPR